MDLCLSSYCPCHHCRCGAQLDPVLEPAPVSRKGHASDAQTDHADRHLRSFRRPSCDVFPVFSGLSPEVGGVRTQAPVGAATCVGFRAEPFAVDLLFPRTACSIAPR